MKNLLTIMAISVWAVLSYWILWPYKPIEVHSIRVLNPDKAVQQGGDLIYEVSYTKNMNVIGTLSRKLVNAFIIDLADTKVSMPAGSAVRKVRVRLPSYADPGVYRLRWTVTYPVNPIREVSVAAESEPFTIGDGK